MPRRLLLGYHLLAKSDPLVVEEWACMAADCRSLLNGPPVTVLAGRTAAVLLAPTIGDTARLKVDGNLEPTAVLIDAWREDSELD
jgi:hypothetical protein